MDLKPALLRLTAALVAILAIAAVAASLPIVMETPGSGDDGGGAEPSVTEPDAESESVDPGSAFILRAIMIATFLLMGLALLAIVLHDRMKLLKRVLQISVVVAIFVVISYFAIQAMELGSRPPMNVSEGNPPNSTPDQSPGTGGGADATSTPLLTATELVELGVVVIGLVIIGVILRRYLHQSDSSSEGVADVQADVGAAAGAAADRIENQADPSVENAVYDAWYKMTTYLPVEEPETSTPGEFAAAAITTGIDRGDVEELTSLFESVRYGPESATPLTERRAVEILRRIEATYHESADETGTTVAETSSEKASDSTPERDTSADSTPIGTETDPNERDEG